jgi:hypothetical protein
MTRLLTRRKVQSASGDGPVLNHALRQGELSPTCLTFGLTVVQAIGDVARVAYDGSPVSELISKACKAFAKYAAEQDAAHR